MRSIHQVNATGHQNSKLIKYMRSIHEVHATGHQNSRPIVIYFKNTSS